MLEVIRGDTRSLDYGTYFLKPAPDTPSPKLFLPCLNLLTLKLSALKPKSSILKPQKPKP